MFVQKHYMDMHLVSVHLCKCGILKQNGLVVHGCVFVSSYASLQFILGFVYVGQHDLLCVCVCLSSDCQPTGFLSLNIDVLWDASELLEF